MGWVNAVWTIVNLAASIVVLLAAVIGGLGHEAAAKTMTGEVIRQLLASARERRMARARAAAQVDLEDDMAAERRARSRR